MASKCTRCLCDIPPEDVPAFLDASHLCAVCAPPVPDHVWAAEHLKKTDFSQLAGTVPNLG